MENIYKYCKDYTPLIRCYECNTCGPSLSNKDIESIVELMLDEALKNHNFNLDDVKLSIVSNIQNISTVQDDLNNYKVELTELLNNYVETNVLEALRNNLENADVDLNNSIQLIKDTLTNNLGTEVSNLENLIDALQISVGASIADLSTQINSLIPTRDAYKIAKENGFLGSESTWLESLKGKSAYEIAKLHGYSGSESGWVNSLKGEQGPRGLPGARGLPGINGEDGKDGKDGKDGINGLSAYELAKKEGFVGSVDYWLQSLKGDEGVGIQKIEHNTDDTLTITYTDSSTYTTRNMRGPQGIQGPEAKSAYDIAKYHGFKGSEEDWLKYILENSETITDIFADADSLEQFINGSEDETVLTRLSAEYPTLQKAIKQLFENGGLPATPFKTKALMLLSAPPSGSYAVVTDDSNENVGLWLRDDANWIKSKYDVYNNVNNAFVKKATRNTALKPTVLNGRLVNSDPISANNAAHITNSQGSIFRYPVSGVSMLKISGAYTANPNLVWVFANNDDNIKINDGGFYGNGLLPVPKGAKWAYRDRSYKEWAENPDMVVEAAEDLSGEDAFIALDNLRKNALVGSEYIIDYVPYIYRARNINTDLANPDIVTGSAPYSSFRINVENVDRILVSGAKEDKDSIKWVFAADDGNKWMHISDNFGNGEFKVPKGAKWAYRGWGSSTWEENEDIDIKLVFKYPEVDPENAMKESESAYQRSQRLIRESGMPVVKVSDFEGSTSHDKIDNAITYIKAQGEGILDLEKGVHLRESAILMPSNCWLYLNDSVLRLADGVHDNLIRNDGIVPDPDPHGLQAEINENHNIRIFGNGIQRSGIYGPDKPYTAVHPYNGGDPIEWVGDDWGWRTLEINLINVKDYEIHDFRLYGSRCWAICQQHGCENFKIYNIEFESHVPNGDGIDILMGCKNGEVYNITGHTHDDTVALSAADSLVTSTPQGNYIYPMMQGSWQDRGFGLGIENVVIKNIRGSGANSCIRLLTGKDSFVRDVRISNISDNEKGYRGYMLLITSGWPTVAPEGSMKNIFANNVRSDHSAYAMRFQHHLQDSWFNNISQHNPKGALRTFRAIEKNVTYTNIYPPLEK